MNEATRLCDICGKAYFGQQFGPYGDNICPDCMKSDELKLVSEDTDIQESISENIDEDGGGDNDAD